MAGGVGTVMTAAVRKFSQFRGTVSSNLAFRLDRLERLWRKDEDSSLRVFLVTPLVVFLWTGDVYFAVGLLVKKNNDRLRL